GGASARRGARGGSRLRGPVGDMPAVALVARRASTAAGGRPAWSVRLGGRGSRRSLRGGGGHALAAGARGGRAPVARAGRRRPVVGRRFGGCVVIRCASVGGGCRRAAVRRAG